MFKDKFNDYTCEGDTITCKIDGFTIIATIEYEDYPDKPDQRNDGFWPSSNPNEAGYVGEKNVKNIDELKQKAHDIMEQWERGDWFYCGIVLKVMKGAVVLNSHAASLWGIECNYPGSDNSYLTEVANELLPEALTEGKKVLESLFEEK